jgi:hypothetical protein
MVGADAEGNLFIFDAGNKLIRMMDTNGIMHTMIDGACRLDRLMPTPDIPFDLTLRGTVCYKVWKRKVIEIEHKKPVQALHPDEYAELLEELVEAGVEEPNLDDLLSAQE